MCNGRRARSMTRATHGARRGRHCRHGKCGDRNAMLHRPYLNEAAGCHGNQWRAIGQRAVKATGPHTPRMRDGVGPKSRANASNAYLSRFTPVFQPKEGHDGHTTRDVSSSTTTASTARTKQYRGEHPSGIHRINSQPKLHMYIDIHIPHATFHVSAHSHMMHAKPRTSPNVA